MSDVKKSDVIERYDYIDALRGFAASGVILYHLALIPKPNLELPSWLARYIGFGSSGVTLFFIVSAFTLCLSIRLRGLEANAVFDFYIRRLFRIVPLFYFWLVLRCLRDELIWDLAKQWKRILLSSFFGFNFIPGYELGIVWASWTLGIEMVFYLFFPFIFKRVSTIRRALGFLLLTFIVAYIFRLLAFKWVIPTKVDSYVRFSIFTSLPIFATGILAFHCYWQFIRGRVRPVFSAYFFLVLGLAIIVLRYQLRLGFLGLYFPCLAFVPFLFGLAIHEPRLIVNRVTTFLGEISYSLYLNHPPVIYSLRPIYRLIYEFPGSVLLKFCGCALLTFSIVVPISYLTYKFIEVPGIQLGKRFIKYCARAKTSRMLANAA